MPKFRERHAATAMDEMLGALDELIAARWPVPDDPQAARLSNALRSAASGGKRSRPRLLALAHDALGGSESDALVPVAFALELLHTAFLVHDDLIDGDDLRRGRPSVPGQFLALGATTAGAPGAPAREYAVAGAVLTGDLALAAALRAVATAPVDRPTVDRLLDLFDRALTVSAAGELADVEFSLRPGQPSLAEVLHMAERKTAEYSFALPLQCGAVLAGAPAGTVEALGRAGRLVGVAFQLYDDLAGMFGDPETTGKTAGSDLREGKCTPLVVHARGTSAWATIAPYLGDPKATDEDLARVRALLEECGSRAYVEHLASQQLTAAATISAELGLPPHLVAEVDALGRPADRGAA